MWISEVTSMRLGYISTRIKIQGIVQGVGFRPYIYNLAKRLDISGTVRNTSSGVIIEATSSPDVLETFYNQIQSFAPRLSRIDTICREPITPFEYPGFTILESDIFPGAYSLVPPDMATCPECQVELFDPTNRRYRYPFINCTNCGPRFSIIRKMPYDRAFTSMAEFPMCPECHQEYSDPGNRRFHAEPIACPTCGPELAYYQENHPVLKREEALQEARTLIQSGEILALKGLGGYQLVCDASNPETIARLRKGKLRNDKPFALMAYDASIISKYCNLSAEDEKMLLSSQHPIVILPARPSLLQQNAPRQNTLGFMLPYTPLHFLITELSTTYPEVLVMTSGNISDEPMLIEDKAAINHLNHIADGFLGHNRPILNRVDDSVYQSSINYSIPIRMARGYSPDPILIAEDLPQVFASGALLKNTFALVQNKQAFVSHFIGDLDNLEAFKDYELSIQKYFDLFQFTPVVVACDLHPDYLSTRFATVMAEDHKIPVMQIQHHHAHLAACLAENRYPLDKNVIALCYDGTGYGQDGNIWGGEILVGNSLSYKRIGHLQYLPLPGGDLAIKKPYRIALAYLAALGLSWDPSFAPVQYCSSGEAGLLKDQIEKKINISLNSSMGRLFDAVSSLIGIRQEVSYEGQAAIELEAMADPDEDGIYPYIIQDGIINVLPIINLIIADIKKNVQSKIISARFHNTIAQLSIESIETVMKEFDCDTVALSGGVWQNSLLLTKTIHLLKKNGINFIFHKLLPPNDGCISLGQAVIAGKNYKRKI
jgi:hydrogenase maturation protein HypF